MKINVESISRTALGLLDEVGVGGLSMRLVAGRLGVQPPALYYHVKNKAELLDVLAMTIFTDAADSLEAPRAGVSWQDWLGDWARRLRKAMLRYRDGARIFAGRDLRDPTVFRATELALRTLQDAGFPIQQAARSVAALENYTVGFTTEEQAHRYGDAAPAAVDAGRFPLTATAYPDDRLSDPDTDGAFEHGLATMLAGMREYCS